MAFDAYGRRLALREMLGRRQFRPAEAEAVWHGLVNPVACVRHFEFDFAARALGEIARNVRGQRVLDISSPRLFPFWAAETQGFEVTMINPDRNDIARSREVARHVSAPSWLEIAGGADATDLGFADDSFDAAVSISVIEHVGGDGDRRMVEELARVVRPGGRIVLTFPVKPSFETEYRADDYYGTQPVDEERGEHFFQRFYDAPAIAGRLLSCPRVAEVRRQYFVEDPPGWFARYEEEWMRSGLVHTVKDPWFMSQFFRDAGRAHPEDRMGVCGLILAVAGERVG